MRYLFLKGRATLKSFEGRMRPQGRRLHRPGLKCSSFVNLGGLHLKVTKILLLMLEERMNSPYRMAAFFGVLM